MNARKNITFTLLDYKKGHLHLTGQHESVIVVRNGQLELIDTADLGFPLGLEKDIADWVTQIKVELNSGDLVVLYTDGITEAENFKKEQYGIERLGKIVKQNWHRAVTDIRKVVIDDVQQYIGKQEVFDDITLLVIRQN